MKASLKLLMATIFLIESITIFVTLLKTEEPPANIDHNQTGEHYESEFTPALTSSIFLLLASIMVFSFYCIPAGHLNLNLVAVNNDSDNDPLLLLF